MLDNKIIKLQSTQKLEKGMSKSVQHDNITKASNINPLSLIGQI